MYGNTEKWIHHLIGKPERDHMKERVENGG
jgi:hypothetical protein